MYHLQTNATGSYSVSEVQPETVAFDRAAYNKLVEREARPLFIMLAVVAAPLMAGCFLIANDQTAKDLGTGTTLQVIGGVIGLIAVLLMVSAYRHSVGIVNGRLQRQQWIQGLETAVARGEMTQAEAEAAVAQERQIAIQGAILRVTALDSIMRIHQDGATNRHLREISRKLG